MKTKLFSLFLMLIISIGTLLASDTQVDGIWYNFSSSALTAEVTYSGTSYNSSFDEYTGSIVIPASVTYNGKNYTVTSIGEEAFRECSRLISITISNSVTSIGRRTFYNCTGLTSVTIGNSVTSIGNSAFSGCSSLTSVVIPNSVHKVLMATFAGCSNLASVTVGNKVTHIQESAFSGCTSLTSIEIPNSVIEIGNTAFSACSGLTSVKIGNRVRSIGDYAFSLCTGLTSIEIPNSITRIGREAFVDCRGMTSVTCYAITPPSLSGGVFSYIAEDRPQIPLYVPVNSVDAYKAADQWKDFNPILPISAKETETTGIQTTSTENSVDISWPAVTGAASYELVIKDAGGNKICTLVFNANGQLVSLVFHAPARNNAPQQLQEAGFVFTVTGLNPGTEYTYTFTATNNSGDVLRTESGTFYTNGTQGIEDVQTNNVRSTKVAKDGQILILRGDKIYTLQGQEVK